MRGYTEQLECLHCSHSRSFVLHGDREQRILGQTEAVRIAKQTRRAVLTCARCGSSSLVRCWADAMPYATAGIPRRRRKSALPAQTLDS
jgi:hypothetical protein